MENTLNIFNKFLNDKNDKILFFFINQKVIDDLIDDIHEEFGLNSSNNNSKDNKKKKQSVEDRIIKRCEIVQRGCSLALDQNSYVYI